MSRKIKNPNVLFLLFAVLLVIPVRCLIKTFTFLTRYFPISLFFTNSIFHYNHKDIDIAFKIVSDKSIFSNPAFLIESTSMDQYFVYLEGDFIRRKYARISDFKEKLENKFGKGNVFLNKGSNGLKRIGISRQIISEVIKK